MNSSEQTLGGDKANGFTAANACCARTTEPFGGGGAYFSASTTWFSTLPSMVSDAVLNMPAT